VLDLHKRRVQTIALIHPQWTVLRWHQTRNHAFNLDGMGTTGRVSRSAAI
jgi:hypothetical protein